jgi:hypothetical protein
MSENKIFKNSEEIKKIYMMSESQLLITIFKEIKAFRTEIKEEVKVVGKKFINFATKKIVNDIEIIKKDGKNLLKEIKEFRRDYGNAVSFLTEVLEIRLDKIDKSLKDNNRMLNFLIDKS